MQSVDVFNKNQTETEMDFDEPMDTNETPFDDFQEEGEINTSDDEDKHLEKPAAAVPSIFTRKDKPPEFVTGFNVFDKSEELRKLDRAKRFALPIKPTNIEEIQHEQLLNLHRDLGIDKENERHYRLNVIHMRGTEDMSTEDVLNYFMSYAPSHIEWVNDVSCNVVWTDDVSAARALLNMSQRIKNLDKVHINADPFEKDFKATEIKDEDMDDNAVDARTIKAAIPPGFWRIGHPSEKSSFILLRYATRSDKKHQYAEKNSEYYKKYGNPNFGNIPGILSKSLRNEFKKSKYKNQDTNSLWRSNSKETEVPSNDKKNPWEELAHEWGRSDKVEVEKHNFTKSRILKREYPITSDVPDLRISLQNKKENKERSRVKYNRSNFESSDNEIWESKRKIPRMKMYADYEEKKLEKHLKGNLQRNQLEGRPVEDLRSKINRKKIRPRFKFRSEKEKPESSNSDSNNSENEYEDGEYSDWALEQYHDLRESLDQNKRQERKMFSVRKYYESEQEEEEDEQEEEEEDEDFYNINLGHRSPLQIEIDNDEYVGNKRH